MKVVDEKSFISFMKRNNPEKLRYDPKIIEIVGNNVVFEMKEHKGQFVVNILSNTRQLNN